MTGYYNAKKSWGMYDPLKHNSGQAGESFKLSRSKGLELAENA